MTDHNTLDDLVRVARARILRCVAVGCMKPATRSGGYTYFCDRCGDAHGTRVELNDADAIRRLVKAGVL